MYTPTKCDKERMWPHIVFSYKLQGTICVCQKVAEIYSFCRQKKLESAFETKS